MLEPAEWQHNDRLIAGAEEGHPSIRYRRTRLLLLPAAKVPDREYIVSITKALQGMETPPSDATIQAQGFYALMDLLENARWSPAGVEKEPLSITQFVPSLLLSQALLTSSFPAEQLSTHQDGPLRSLKPKLPKPFPLPLPLPRRNKLDQLGSPACKDEERPATTLLNSTATSNSLPSSIPPKTSLPPSVEATLPAPSPSSPPPLPQHKPPILPVVRLSK
jgi:hypothetical protein